MSKTKSYLLIAAILLMLMLQTANSSTYAQCYNRCCGVVGSTTNAVLSIPMAVTSSLSTHGCCAGEYQGCCGCCRYSGCNCCSCYTCNTGCCRQGDSSCCGVIGSIADAIVAIPAKILGAFTSHSCPNGPYCGCVEYPCGCASGCCAANVIEVAPAVQHETVPPAPVYVTYGIVSKTPPVRPVPPVVTFNGPLQFDR